MAAAPSRAGRLPAARLAAYSALMVSIAGASFPLTAYLPAFYAHYHGIALGTVGLIFALVRIADTLWDPLKAHRPRHPGGTGRQLPPVRRW
jgi:Na+/melibiose symporter-like transporter